MKAPSLLWVTVMTVRIHFHVLSGLKDESWGEHVGGEERWEEGQSQALK